MLLSAIVILNLLSIVLIQLLCISTSFHVLRAPESWWKIFFSAIFNLSSSLKKFSVHFHLKSLKKVLKCLKKLCFKLLYKSWFTKKSWSTPWGGTLNLYFLGVFWPVFGCAQHPKAGWNTKHTTIVFMINSFFSCGLSLLRRHPFLIIYISFSFYNALSETSQ